MLEATKLTCLFLARWFDLPIGLNLEGVSLKTEKDMHMDIKHLLKCGFP